jgi:hypothetical protein
MPQIVFCGQRQFVDQACLTARPAAAQGSASAGGDAGFWQARAMRKQDAALVSMPVN